jgi:ubiquinone biosynthesis protein COQ9
MAACLYALQRRRGANTLEAAMIDPTTSKGRVVTAALRLAAERPWSEVTMLDIAEASNLGLVEMRKEFASKAAILAAFTRAIDDVVLAKATRPQPGTAPRDAIFEVVMGRFDAMQPYKAGLKSIIGTLGFDTGVARRLFASQAWMLNAAGIPLDGVGGTVRVFGLASVYTSVFRTWLEDDDAGLARTMAALDRRLRRGEQSLQTFDGICGSVSRMFETLARGGRSASGSAGEEKPAAAGFEGAPDAR